MSDPSSVIDANMLARSAGIDPNNIQKEFVNLPGELAYWTTQYASAVEEYLTRKAAYEVEEARISMSARTSFEVSGKKATEATIAEAVRTTDEWIKVRTALIRAEGNKLRLHGIVSAVEAKREMLVSLGAHIRMEMQAFPSVATAGAARQSQAHNRSSAGDVNGDWLEDLRKNTR